MLEGFTCIDSRVLELLEYLITVVEQPATSYHPVEVPIFDDVHSFKDTCDPGRDAVVGDEAGRAGLRTVEEVAAVFVVGLVLEVERSCVL